VSCGRLWAGNLQDVRTGNLQDVWTRNLQDVRAGNLQDVWAGNLQDVRTGNLQDVWTYSYSVTLALLVTRKTPL
jgi:hypothetical protein